MDIVTAMQQSVSAVCEETEAAQRAAEAESEAEREADEEARAKVRALGEDGLVVVIRAAEYMAQAAWDFGRSGRVAQAMDMRDAIKDFRKAMRGEL